MYVCVCVSRTGGGGCEGGYVCSSGGSCDGAHRGGGKAGGGDGATGGGRGGAVSSLSSLFPLHLDLPRQCFFHREVTLLWVQLGAAEQYSTLCACVCVCVLVKDHIQSHILECKKKNSY